MINICVRPAYVCNNIIIIIISKQLARKLNITLFYYLYITFVRSFERRSDSFVRTKVRFVRSNEGPIRSFVPSKVTSKCTELFPSFEANEGERS